LEKHIRLNTDRLRALREEHGWSQRELARLCGFGETQISKYEAGVVDPSASNLALLADVLGVSADYLLGRADLPEVGLGQTGLDEDEKMLVIRFRRDGWTGVIRLGAERLAK